MTASNNINITVKDDVSPNIAIKLSGISSAAKDADSNLKKLQATLKNLGVGTLINFQNAANAAAQATLRLQTAQARLAAATAQATAAQQRAITATTNALSAQQRLATATSNAAAAAARAALAQLRLAQAQKAARDGTESLFGSLTKFASLMTAGLGAERASQSIIEMSDGYQLLINRLQNVSKSQAQTNELMTSLIGIANDTHQPVNDVVNTYQRFDRALGELGASQQESLRFTKTLNELLMVSGDTTAEASAATIQLSQALNAGKLQGNDFHSIASELPALLDAIAVAMKAPVSSLKQLSTEGKITSDVVRRAMAAVAQQADALSSRNVETFSQAITGLRNNMEIAIGQWTKSSGVAHTLTSAIDELSRNLDVAVASLKVFGAALTVAMGPKVLNGIKVAFIELTAAMMANPVIALATAITAAGVAIYEFSDKIKPLNDGITTLGDIGAVVFDRIKDGVTGALDWIIRKLDFVKEAYDKLMSYFKSSPNTSQGAVGYIGILGEAQARAIARQNAQNADNSQSALRGSGPSNVQPAPTKTHSTGGLTYQSIMDRLNEQLIQAGQHGADVSLQAQFQHIIDEAKHAKLALSADQKGTIYEVLKKIVDLRASDAMSKVNRKIDDERSSLNFLGDAYEVNTKVMSIYEQEHDKLGDKARSFAESKRQELVQLQKETLIWQQLQQIWNNTRGEVRTGANLATAYLRAGQTITTTDADGGVTVRAPLVNPETSASGQLQGRLQSMRGRINSGFASTSDIVTSAVGQATDGFTNISAGLTDSFGGFFQSFDEGFANSIGKAVTGTENFSAALKDVANNAMQQLISSLAQVAIKMSISKGLESLFGIVTGGSSSVMESFSGAGISALQTGGLAKGYADGGYTGDGVANSVAGIVHKGEYVMDKNSVSRIGAATLDNLRAMGKSAMTGGMGSGGNVIQTYLGGITIQGANFSDGKPDPKILEQFSAAMADIANKQISRRLTNEMRPNGALYNYRTK